MWQRIAALKEHMTAKDTHITSLEEELRTAITELYSNRRYHISDILFWLNCIRRHIANLKEMNELLRYELEMKFDTPLRGELLFYIALTWQQETMI